MNKPNKRGSFRELFAAIPHSVIDSPAYSNLTGQAIRLLTIIARQYNGANNGLMQATHKYCEPRGIVSEHTLKSAINDLIAHGFIVRTRSRGNSCGKNIWAYYALTWYPPCSKQLRDARGVHFDGFVPEAWKMWKPNNSG